MNATPQPRPELERIRLPTEVSFACKKICGRRFSAPFHHHPEMELTAIHAGHGQRFTGDVVEEFQAGDVVLLGSHLPHAWFCAADCRRAEATVVQFQALTLGGGVLAAPELGKVRSMLDAASGGIVLDSCFASELHELPAMPPGLQLIGLLKVLVSAAEKPCRPLKARTLDKALTPLDRERLDKALRYLHEHHNGSVKLADLARHVSLGPEAFSRFFRRATGRTFIETLNHIRLASAMRMLHETDEKIATVAAACGFEDVSHFNRQFRRRYGCAPGQVRSTL